MRIEKEKAERQFQQILLKEDCIFGNYEREEVCIETLFFEGGGLQKNISMALRASAILSLAFIENH